MDKRFIDPKYLKPHYSTKLWRTVYNFCVANYSKDMFIDICTEMKMPVEFLLEDDNWVSNAFVTEFFTKLRRVTRDRDLLHSLGLVTLSRENINSFEYVLLSSLTPFLFFKSVPNNYSKVNLINKIECLKARPGEFVFRVHPADQELAFSGVCQNTIGIWESAGAIFGLDSISVVHTECLHDGGQSCVFHVNYSAIRFWKKRIASMLMFIGGGAGGVALVKHFSFDSWIWWSPAVYLALWATSIGFFVYFKKYRELEIYNKYYYEQSRKRTLALHQSVQKLDRRYRESKLLSSLSSKLIKLQKSSDVIAYCLDELANTFGYEKVMVMLLSSDEKNLYTADVRGFGSDANKVFQLTVRYPAEKDTPQLFANILASGKVRLINNIPQFSSDLKPENSRLIEMLGVRSLIISPIEDEEKKYGLMIAGSLANDRELNEDDRYLIEEVTRMLSLHFQSARNFENEQTLRSVFQKYLPKIVLETIDQLRSTGTGHLTPRLETITSMFIDLRGFTGTSEEMPPERIVQILNIYANYVTKRIAAFGGIVDNLVGDGIVAFFTGQRNGVGTHATDALMAGLAILADINELNSSLLERNYFEMGIGIGISSGMATVGNVGSDFKMNYTAIGDTVNLAARLQDLSKRYREKTPSASKGVLLATEGTITLSQGVSWRVNDIDCQDIANSIKKQSVDLGDVQVRGRKRPVHVIFFDQSGAEDLLGSKGELKKLYSEPNAQIFSSDLSDMRKVSNG